MTEEREPAADRVTESNVIYSGRKATLRVDTIALPGGATSTREIVEHPPVAAVVPLDSEGNIVMVRQYRLAAGHVMLEIPAGVVDPVETPEAAAQRELSEETGLRAGTLTPLANFFVSPGISTEVIHLFLAEDLSDSPGQADDDEDIVLSRVPVSTALLMARRGEFDDAKTLTGILLAAAALGLSH
jgi:ADP-ribose pyrophosphatase